jgi:7,8-dihydropterin-6-yl-methyl-4-(beta-D-ribofuranosyl)aminobenzene 5'-phosphate synthase
MDNAIIRCLRATVLADNCVAAPGPLGEHGLAMLIEADDWRILFDTGQGEVLCPNADALGISLCPPDAVVLRHGNDDHTGGLAGMLRAVTPSAVFVHPAALQQKYASSDKLPHRAIGTAESSRQALDAVQDRIGVLTARTKVGASTLLELEAIAAEVRGFLHEEWGITHVTLEAEANGCGREDLLGEWK